MGKYKIIYEREKCIGAESCIDVNPEFWSLNQDGKADLKESKDVGNSVYEVEIDDKDLEKNIAAADSCPINIITIIDKKTGQKLAPK